MADARKRKDLFEQWVESGEAENNLAIIQSLSMQGKSIAEIASAFDISKRTLQYLQKEHPALEKAIRSGRLSVVAMCQSKLMERVSSGDTTAIIYALKVYGGDFFNDRKSVEANCLRKILKQVKTVARKTNAADKPIIIRPQKGKQELFLRSPADICIYGGAAGGGKTFALLLEALRHIDNSRFEAVIFRQSRPQIMSAGGLFATSQEIYPYLGATSVLTPDVQWRFKSGAKVTFAHMFYEKEKYNWQGSQIPLLMFDELVHFTESQFFYMFSRNRSTCGVRPYIRATCNPDGESWVAKFIDWWIDPETGYADESKCGKLRYFVRRNNIIHWADSPQQLYEEFSLRSPEEMEDVKSVAFISAKLTDNQAMMTHDPGYMGALRAMSEFDQEQLLNGNWKIRRSAGHYFKRSKIGQMFRSVPTDIVKWVRAWDLAATAPGEADEEDGMPQALRKNSRKDGSAYTAGVLLGKRSNGRVFVADS